MVYLPFTIGLLLNVLSCNTAEQDLAIELWYGEEQQFGQYGTPQPMINILGNVSGKGVTSLVYSVNGGSILKTPTGGDLNRLARKGDFNIEIPVSELQNGLNHVELIARDSMGILAQRTVQVQYTRGVICKLPYTVDWNEVSNVQNVVQVVDGKWKLENDGIRVADPYYDRTIAIGDTSWRNYEVSTSVTWNKLPDLVDEEGPPFFKCAHASVVLRWRGHPDDGMKPHLKWWPLGCIFMYANYTHWEKWKWDLWGTGNGTLEERALYRDVAPVQVVPHRKYQYRMRVESLPGSATRYCVKAWDAEQMEPKNWDVVVQKNVEDTPSGSILLVAHHADVTFGPVSIVPLD